jgi:hypothetical protein
VTLPYPQQISTDPAVNASAMAWAAQLVDGLKRIFSGSDPSIFARVPGDPSTRILQYGTTTVTWPGGVNASSYTTVTHGVGKTPVAVIATNAGGPTGYCEVQTIGATTFQVRTVDPLAIPGAATTGTVLWIATG